MKKLLVVGLLLVWAAPASADVYVDAVGDLHDGTGGGADFSGFTHLDIAGMEVTNDLTNINFKFDIVGDILATDWGKYMIIMDSIPGGDPVGNGWGRPISMDSGADYWVGSWVDSGDGAETYHWDGGAWVLDNATWSPPSDISVSDKTQFTVTLTTTLSSLGLSVGDSFAFDAFSSGGGGGDGAVDSLNNASPQILDWGDQSSAAEPYSMYTVIPEPASLALLALGGLAMLRRRR